MEIKEHIEYWLKCARHDLEIAESLFASKKYDYCLFLGHLVLEKVLKAIFVKNNSNYSGTKTFFPAHPEPVEGLMCSESISCFDQLSMNGHLKSIT